MAGHTGDNGNHAARVFGMADTLARTGVRSGEMGVAAAETIGYRSAMLADALADPRKLANPEFTRMGSEKVIAAAQAAQEMVESLVDLQQSWVALWTGQARAAALLFGGLGTVRSPAEVVGLFQESFDAGMSATLGLAESAAMLAGAGLGPIHRKTRANARRLRRRNGGF